MKKYRLQFDYYTNRIAPLSFGDQKLYQIGRVFCKPDTVISRHAQANLFELTVARSGKGIVYTNDIPSKIQPGDIYLSFPGDFHEIRSDAKTPLNFDCLAFDTTNEQLHRQLDVMMESAFEPQHRITRNNRICTLIDDMIEEFSTEERSEQLLNAILTSITIYLIRSYTHTLSQPQPTRADAKMLCLHLMNYIDTHIYAIQNLNEIAQAMSYNYSYLSDLFCRTTNGTLQNYYQNRRMETARLLIEERTFSLTQISEMLNYSTVYAFSRAFHNYYGMSPRAYRNQNRTE